MENLNSEINAWDKTMGAATFAEAGEFDTASAIMNRKTQRQQTTLRLWDRVMAAITFAEAGEHETATQIMDRKNLQSRTSVQKQVDKRPRLQA
jgi:hypothetical protein